MDDNGEHDDDEVGAHLRRNRINRRGHHARERRQRRACAIGQHHHARHVDAERTHQCRVLRRRAQISAKPRAFDDVPGAEADQRRCHDHPGAIGRQVHEAEILHAPQRFGDHVGQPRRAEILPEQALDDERQPEGQYETVKMVDLVGALEQHLLDDNADHTDAERREDQRGPVADTEIFQQYPRAERAHHVLHAMNEIHDVQQTEDDGKAEAHHGVERAIDEADQKLTEQCLGRNAEQRDDGHVAAGLSAAVSFGFLRARADRIRPDAPS